jgi:hypothetical protein
MRGFENEYKIQPLPTLSEGEGFNSLAGNDNHYFRGIYE